LKRIEIYSTQDGKEPFSDWLDGLDEKAQFKVMAYVERVALGGSKKNVRSLGDQVLEIKIDYGPGYRVYFGELEGVIMLLLAGGDKGSQRRDITKAKEYWRSRDV
jgi:putative addiction module killer protein